MNKPAVYNILSVIGVGLSAVEQVARQAEAILGEDHTIEQLAMVAQTLVAVVGSIRGGLDGTVSVEGVNADLAKLVGRIRDNNAAVDAAIDAKFPPAE